MGKRDDYPFHKRDQNRTTKMVSNLLTGFIVAPFIALNSLSKTSIDSEHKPASKKYATALFITGIALLPFSIMFFAYGVENTLSIICVFPTLMCLVMIIIAIDAFIKHKASKKGNSEINSKIKPNDYGLTNQEDTKEIERRRIMEEKCAKLRAEIEKDKEEEQKRKIASFQYQYSEEREEIRKRIRKELKN